MSDPLPEKLMAGKVVLVTGAARGFGTGIARGFARAGAHLCVLDIELDELAQAEAEIAVESSAAGGELVALVADVTDLAQMQAAVDQAVNRWGRLDVMVNNAAIMPRVTFEETTPEIWRRIIDVNLTGVYHGVKAAWPHFVRQGGGHSMAIASGSSVRGSAREAAYCATKHGLEGFTKALAVEAEPHNIAVNTIGPGKRIKPTSVSRAEATTLPPEEQAIWNDPVILAPAFIWLAMQPPARFTGLRFDAGPIVDAIAAEGYDFAVTPEKVTSYVDDFVQRLEHRARWTQLPLQT
jgi:NAD(P)-dependent dehydrogenase (short-subunit alcohol dehydrogenase family)